MSMTFVKTNKTMKANQIIKSLQNKAKKINKTIASMQKDMEKIFQIENPTKEQMKEAVLLFGGIGHNKKILKEINTTIAGLNNLIGYNIDSM